MFGNVLALEQSWEEVHPPSGFSNCSLRMDVPSVPLRRRDVWLIGSVCLLSSSFLWLVFRSLTARGGTGQAPALQAKEKFWPHGGVEGTTCVKGKRTSPPTERSSQKKQTSSEEAKVYKLNKKNAEKTSIPPSQRSFAAFPTEKSQHAEEDSGSRNAIEPRGSTERRDIPCMQRLNREGKQGAGDKSAILDRNGGVVFKEEKNGLDSKEDNSAREARTKEESASAAGTLQNTRSSKNQPVDDTSGDRVYDRYICSEQALALSSTQGRSTEEPAFQSADPAQHASSSKRRGTEACISNEELKKSRTKAVGPDGGHACRTPNTMGAQGGIFQEQGPAGETPATQTTEQPDLVTPLDDIPAPPAPFSHRIVTAKQAAINSFYTVNRTEMLGGGRFGQVHKCEEKATGLKLAAKIIRTKNKKEKDEVRNEINIMNQLDHVNLIQLYDAFESKNDFVLVMEYVDGGELFDRIIDDNYNLTELDTILFIKQICEGIRHMHQMYILHLDLKPENILCVNREAKQIKIIDFGLARRYQPREKLKVNFGTPEFLAPEVVNYDFVSFPTDMWSVGVITYMLLSGLSPFLGDNDVETLNNILACSWDLEEAEFRDLSDEGREFISKLLIKEKSWRISASEALKHPWLSDHKLHSRLKTQKKNCHSDAQKPVTK